MTRWFQFQYGIGFYGSAVCTGVVVGCAVIWLLTPEMTPEWFVAIAVMLAAATLVLGLFGVIWLVRMCRQDDRAGPPRVWYWLKWHAPWWAPVWTWGWLWRIAARQVDAWHARRANP